MVFNKYIRERDAELGCISCGGKVQQCGHYFSQGHYSALRYDPINCNGQCIRCNQYLHGNLIFYRIGLVIKYGEESVRELELKASMTRTKKWSRDELQDIIQIYK